VSASTVTQENVSKTVDKLSQRSRPPHKAPDSVVKVTIRLLVHDVNDFTVPEMRVIKIENEPYEGMPDDESCRLVSVEIDHGDGYYTLGFGKRSFDPSNFTPIPFHGFNMYAEDGRCTKCGAEIDMGKGCSRCGTGIYAGPPY